MSRLFIALLAGLLVLPLAIGCGGSDSVGTTAGQDELSSWVAENPAPPEIPLTNAGVEATE